MFRRSLLTGAGAAGMLSLSSVRPARADAMADAKKRGTLIVGMEVAYVPYEFFKDGKILGYDPDIIAHGRPQARREGANHRHGLGRHHSGAVCLASSTASSPP
jgi:hypothetical protein